MSSSELLSFAQHGQDHLESLFGAHRMRFAGGHQHDLAGAYTAEFSSYCELAFSFDYLNQRIERRRVLAQSLSCVEGKQGDRAGAVFHKRPAYHCPFAVIHKPRQIEDLRPLDVLFPLLLCHALSPFSTIDSALRVIVLLV